MGKAWYSTRKKHKKKERKYLTGKDWNSRRNGKEIKGENIGWTKIRTQEKK